MSASNNLSVPWSLTENATSLQICLSRLSRVDVFFYSKAIVLYLFLKACYLHLMTSWIHRVYIDNWITNIFLEDAHLWNSSEKSRDGEKLLYPEKCWLSHNLRSVHGGLLRDSGHMTCLIIGIFSYPLPRVDRVLPFLLPHPSSSLITGTFSTGRTEQICKPPPINFFNILMHWGDIS